MKKANYQFHVILKNLSMIKKKISKLGNPIASRYICLTLLLFGISCQTNYEDNITPTKSELSDETLTLASAQKWFQEQGGFGLRNARIEDEGSTLRFPDWGNGKQGENHEGKEALIFPIYHDPFKKLPAITVTEDKSNLKLSKETILESAGIQEFLSIYKNKEGKNQARLIQLIPDKKYRKQFRNKNKYDDYSGYILISNIDETIELGLQFDEGKLIKNLKILPNTTKNAKVSELFCQVTVTYYFYTVSVAGVIYNFGNNGSSSTLYCWWESPNGSPSSNYTSNYGGGGSSYSTTSTSNTSGIPSPPDPSTDLMNCVQLRSWNGEAPKNQWDFYDANLYVPYQTIQNQRPSQSFFPNGSSQPGGPLIRYISDPLNPDIVIDMRHFMVIGKAGRATGNSVEIFQYLAGWASGGNHQDYYSNALGYKFWEEYGTALQSTPEYFASWLISFLNDPSKRTENIVNPGFINNRCH